MPPGTKLRNVRVGEELWQAAQGRADEDETTMSEAIRALLALWIAGDIKLPKGTQ